jgi:hypothetical protein
MKKLALTPNFRFSFGTLIGIGEKTGSLMSRDQAELLTYGVTDADRSFIQQKTDELKNMPDDDEFLGIGMERTTTKDTIADKLRVEIRSYMVRVADVYGESSGTYRRFGTAGLSKLTDSDLLLCCKRVLRLTGTYFDALKDKGITQQMIEGLTSLCSQFDDALGLKEDADMDREVAAEQRMELANVLYAKINRISGFGKDYWYTRSEAKYNDYLIYDTPSGTKEEDAPPVTPT